MTESNVVDLTTKVPGQKGRVYRVSFIRASKEQKEQFQNSRCAFLISVGQGYHKDAKLAASLKYMDRYFKGVNVVVGDSIQRYTFAILQNRSPEELLDFAENEGLKWIERHTPIIQKTLTKPYKISRLGQYERHSKFAEYYREIDFASKNDREFQLCLEQDAQEFLDRLNKNGVQLSSISMDLCLEYLKTESACMRLFAYEGCEFAMYPNGMPKIIQKTCEQYIASNAMGSQYLITYCIKATRRSRQQKESSTLNT